MPSEGSMPLRLSGIAVSRPGREAWLADELLDTILPHDPDARVLETRYRGVFLLYSSLEPVDTARIVSRGVHSFMKRYTPAMHTLESPSREGVEGLVYRLLEVLDASAVRLIVSLRGRGKRLGGRSLIEELVRRHGIALSRRARHLIIIESIEDLLIAASGITGSCGYDCITVVPPA
ncbi:MAG: hypothetical protein GSR86_00995 [Desulfurococcales archaeon]|nr:hypothetical protein [Desulfurococcales archaeon]